LPNGVALWGRVAYISLSGSPTNPQEKRANKMNELTNEEVFKEVNSILVDYTDLTKRFWYLYEQLDDETADLVTKAGADKWLKYAFTLSMDELWFEAMSWELTPKDLETKVCGACGQFINATEQDSEGNHKPELCDANDEIEGE
jgi:hypothetical protein